MNCAIQTCGKVDGGMVKRHSRAGGLVGLFFERRTGRRTKTIVVVSENNRSSR